MVDAQHAEFAHRDRFGDEGTVEVSFSADFRDYVECRFFVVKDPEGVLCAQTENLPGVFTYGNTFEEVDAAMREAFELALETHLAEGEDIPWQEMHESLPSGSIRRRVLVHVQAERDKVS